MSNNKDFKKILLILFEDEAIELDLLEKLLHLDKLGSTKSERDKVFIRLAINGLIFTIDSYKSAKKIKYPSAEQLIEFFGDLGFNIEKPAKKSKPKSVKIEEKDHA